MRWGIYVHIPFCRQKCFYCDFPSFAGRESRSEAYTDALCREIMAQGSLLREKEENLTGAATVYFGGGTPTVLQISQLERIIRTLRQNLPVAPSAEFTMEANPGTVSRKGLERLHSLGVNRLSFGVQSFDDGLLQRIGRIHTGQQAVMAVREAQRAGFHNISLDLMYGLPGQSMQELQQSVEQALRLEVQHISIYGLQLEEGTVFAKQQEMGYLELPSEELVEQMYDYMTCALPANGYARYEISNFARAGFESRHNLGYWQDVPYLGLGSAAHSYWQEQRLENCREIGDYIACISAGGSPAREEEPMTRRIAMEEFAFLALRTARGIDLEAFQRKFGCSFASVYAETAARMTAKGLLQQTKGFVYLTDLGMKYGNVVFEAFLLEE